MARKDTILAKKSLTVAQERSRKVAKVLVSLGRSCTRAEYTDCIREINRINNVLVQENDGIGRQVKGSADHTFEGNFDALRRTVDEAGIPVILERQQNDVPQA